MGCDIHVALEHYNKETNQWEFLSLYQKKNGEFVPADVYNGRSYDLFSMLAGVRGSMEPFVYPRGIPDDLSPEVFKEWHLGEEDSWHTPTWYDYCELRAYREVLKAKEKCFKLSLELAKLKSQGSDNDFDLFDYDDDEDEYNYYDLFNGFMSGIDIVLDSYGFYYPKPNEVRVVMWFDS